MSLIKYINTNTKKLYNHKTNDALMTSEFVSTVYTLTDERSEQNRNLKIQGDFITATWKSLLEKPGI